MRQISSLLLVGCLGLASFGTRAAAAQESRQAFETDVQPARFTPLGHVEKRGTGPINMVLIPGLYVDWTVYDAFMSRNSERYTMYAITLPGFGSTAAPAIGDQDRLIDQLWLKNVQNGIVKMMDDEEIESAVFLGHSLGARLAMAMAIEHPARVEKIINLDTLPAVPLPVRNRVDVVSNRLAQSMANLGDLQWAATTRDNHQFQMRDQTRAAEIGQLAGAVPKVIAQRYYLELMIGDVTEEVAVMTTPMLTIAALPSGRSVIGTAAMIQTNWEKFRKDVMSKNSNITLVYFEDCNHYVTEDAPEDLDRAVEAFIKGEPVSARKAKPKQPTEDSPIPPQ